MRMLNDKILVRRVEAETTYGNSNLVIPDNAKEKPSKGEVVAVPSQSDWWTSALKAGEKVLFGKYAGTETQDVIPGETLLIMAEEEILCVLD